MRTRPSQPSRGAVRGVENPRPEPDRTRAGSANGDLAERSANDATARAATPARTGDEPDTERLDRIWRQAYSARTRDDLLALYRDWAETYDDDHRTIGFIGHETTARTLARYVPFRDVATVLDAGAGTGAAGQVLHALGYLNLTAVDLSAAMLAQAEAKGVYRQALQADLGLPLDEFPADHFDAAVAVGVFSFGQAPAHSLDEIVRVVAPGGVVAFTLRLDFFEQDAMGVRSAMERLDRAQAWKLLEVTEPELYLPGKDPDAKFRVWCYRVLETKVAPVDEDFASAVREAFTHESGVHRIDHSFIWNSTGSRLYDRYTECKGYYLTDCEVEILDTDAKEILGDERVLVELGCGSAKKVSRLLQASIARGGEPLTYTPIDVSSGALDATKDELEARFGTAVPIVPRCGRFDDVLASIPIDPPKLIVFFGGSLGNFETVEQTIQFLRTMRDRMGAADRFVVGIDLDKDEQVLRDAYEAGPRNRSFFLNMLRRINNELGGNFDLGAFSQSSPYEPDPPHRDLDTKCVQLRLVTDRAQQAYVRALHMEVELRAGDAVQVGTSRKYRAEQIDRLGAHAGLRLARQWFDRRRFFSLNEFVLADD